MNKLTEADKEDIRTKADSEGFDYYFVYYESPDNTKDAEYKKLWKAYLDARAKLAQYVGADA